MLNGKSGRYEMIHVRAQVTVSVGEAVCQCQIDVVTRVSRERTVTAGGGEVAPWRGPVMYVSSERKT